MREREKERVPCPIQHHQQESVYYDVTDVRESCRVAITNALPRDAEGNDVAYKNNLEQLHAQADEEIAVFNPSGWPT